MGPNGERACHVHSLCIRGQVSTPAMYRYRCRVVRGCTSVPETLSAMPFNSQRVLPADETLHVIIVAIPSGTDIASTECGHACLLSSSAAMPHLLKLPCALP